MARRMTLSGSLVAALLAAGLVVGGCAKKATPAAKVDYANLKCPIMGGPIEAGKVTKDLTREWKGLKVAFCCPMCPGPWDKLTDAQKAAKLKPVLKPGVALPEVEAATKPAVETATKPATETPAKPAATKPAESKPAETKPAK
jgi:hypothetical protein